MAKPSIEKPWMKLWGDDIPDESIINQNLYSFLYSQCKNCMDKPALNFIDTKITYSALFKNIQKTARAFRSIGVRKGDIVTICAVMTPEVVYSFYALDLLGATPNMIDPRTSSEGMKEYIEEVNGRFVVVLDMAYEKMKNAVKGTNTEKVIVLSPANSLPGIKRFLYSLANPDKNKYDSNVMLWNKFEVLGEKGEDLPYDCYDPDHAAVIVHTGGTTGFPKGVMLGDKAYNAIAVQMGHQRFHRGDLCLCIMPPFIAYGYSVGLHLPLSFGCEDIIIPKFEPKNFGKLLNKYHPQHTAGVPLHYLQLSRDPVMKNSDLSYIVSTGCGGDSISTGAEQEVNEFLLSHNSHDPLMKGYGMTELASSITACGLGFNKLGSVGVPLCHSTLGIFKPDTDEELGYNEEGEICATGPNVMLGYYNNPEETAKVKILHSDGKEWIHTGDIGYIDEDGFVFVKNRIKRVIIRHDGFKVYPTAIENVASKVNEVSACCAVPMNDAEHMQGKLPVLFVSIKKDVDKTKDEVLAKVKEICTKELAEYVVPVKYIAIDKMPVTNIGKIDFKKLETMV